MRKVVSKTLLFLVTGVFLTGSVFAQGVNFTNYLTATPWCSFSYNKTTGYSKTTRYQFFSNGTYSSGGRGEGYSSGGGGTFGSQHDSSSGGQWQVRGNLLYYTVGGQLQEPVQLTLKKNRNGQPIIVADSTEFVPCK